MNGIDASRVELLAVAARNSCAWATSSVDQGEHDVGLAIQYLSALFAAGCALGWEAIYCNGEDGYGFAKHMEELKAGYD